MSGETNTAKLSSYRLREILEECSGAQEVTSSLDGVYTYHCCDTYKVATLINEQFATAPARQLLSEEQDGWTLHDELAWLEKDWPSIPKSGVVEDWVLWAFNLDQVHRQHILALRSFLDGTKRLEKEGAK